MEPVTNIEISGLELRVSGDRLTLAQPRASTLEVHLDGDQARLVGAALKYLLPPGAEVGDGTRSTGICACLVGTILTLRKLDVRFQLDLSRTAEGLGGEEALRAAFRELSVPAQTEKTLAQEYLFHRQLGHPAGYVGDYLKARSTYGALLTEAIGALRHEGAIDGDTAAKLQASIQPAELEWGLTSVAQMWRGRLEYELARISSDGQFFLLITHIRLSCESSWLVQEKSHNARYSGPAADPLSEFKQAVFEADLMAKLLMHAVVRNADDGHQESNLQDNFGEAVKRLARNLGDPEHTAALDLSIVRIDRLGRVVSISDVLSALRAGQQSLYSDVIRTSQADIDPIGINEQPLVLGSDQQTPWELFLAPTDVALANLQDSLEEVLRSDISSCTSSNVANESVEVRYLRALDENQLANQALRRSLAEQIIDAHGDVLGALEYWSQRLGDAYRERSEAPTREAANGDRSYRKMRQINASIAQIQFYLGCLIEYGNNSGQQE
ncbi:MAG: hypothetical protein K1X79_05835 [Oligoflexia bacterium]|nr:hypothetical protein [Oligoflexia bacterium]